MDLLRALEMSRLLYLQEQGILFEQQRYKLLLVLLPIKLSIIHTLKRSRLLYLQEQGILFEQQRYKLAL